MMGWLALLVFLSWQERPAYQDPFNTCRTGFDSEPWSWSASNCFFLQAKKSGQWERAETLLKTRLEQYPDHFWIYNALGRIAYDSGGDSAIPWFDAAIRTALEKGQKEAELAARLNLIRCFLDAYRIEDAEAQLNMAETLAQTLGNPQPHVDTVLLRVRYIMESGGDLAWAAVLLDRVETQVFPMGSYELRRDWLLNRGNIDYELGRYGSARVFFETLLSLAQERGDHYLLSVAHWNLASCLLQGELPTAANRDRLLVHGRAALKAATDGKNGDLIAFLTMEVGRLVEGEEGRNLLLRGIELAREGNNPANLSKALGFTANRMVDQDPRRARQLLSESLALARDLEGPWPILYTWHPRLAVNWRSLPPAQALADSLALLDFIEALRGPQLTESGRIDLFSVWTEIYYWLAGHLLRTWESEPNPFYLETAFQITERMRARVLLDSLDANRASHALPANDPLAVRMNGVNQKMVRIHRALMVPQGESGATQSLLRQLEALENQMAELERLVLTETPDLGITHRPELAGLNQLRQGLADHQAVFAFHISYWNDFYGLFRGGAWLWVITREGVKTYALPDQVTLEPVLSLYSELLLSGADPNAVHAASASIYRQVFQAAFEQLSANIDEIILIPDHPLYRLPFGALRPSPDSPPLALRFRFVVTPSATLWLRWKTNHSEKKKPSILVFADPNRVHGSLQMEGDVPVTRNFAQRQPLPALPHAKREGRAIVNRFGSAGTLITGSQASESVFKQMNLQQYNLIHFATHTLTDHENPHRSAVVLAPGQGTQDGLLQPGEIAAADLDAMAVVLSSCQSAGGSARQGEGVMSLARAFSRAGAQSVIATLWPMQDKHAADVFQSFYQRLAAGDSLSTALQIAQRERIEAGAPEEAWAGVVVIGNGNLAFEKVETSGVSLPMLYWLLAAVTTGTGLVCLQRWRKP